MKTYTHEQIEAAWETYNGQKVLEYLENGLKKFRYLEGQRINMTGIQRAKTVDLKSLMSFPEFLEQRWQKSAK
jgi:hypothetical protein